MKNAVTGQGILPTEVLSQLCAYCKEDVDEGNFVLIRQVLYGGEDGRRGGIILSPGQAVVVTHRVCGLPRGKTLVAADDDSDPDLLDDDEIEPDSVPDPQHAREGLHRPKRG